MRYGNLGNTGVAVSELCFGTMTFGDSADEATSKALFGRCLDAGINFFDTADVYAGGQTEEILGRAMKGVRDEIVVATKAYFPTGDAVNDRGNSRYHLVRAVETSLKRLQTDRIDLLYLHRWDELTPIEETMQTLNTLVTHGKILYVGVSNFSAWQTMKAVMTSKLNGWVAPTVLQPMYNLAKRQVEVEMLPMAQSEGIAVCPYSPLGGGLFTGKYRRDAKPGQGRILENPIYELRYGGESALQIAEEFTALADELNVHPASLAVAWVNAHPGVTSTIIGARNVSQLEGSLGALDIDMTPELRDKISALSPAPAPATDRNEEGTGVDYGIRR